MLKSIILFATAILSASCSPERMSNPYGPGSSSLRSSRLMGVIDNGEYFDRYGYFSIPVQNEFWGLKIEEINDVSGNRFGVSFSNDLGCLTRVEVFPQFKECISKITDTSIALNDLLEMTVDSIAAAFPGTKLIESKEVEVEGIGSCSLGIVYIPNGSTMMDAVTGEREDGIRAYILSYADDQLVVISVQEPAIATNIRDGNLKDEAKNNLLMNDAIKVRESYKNRS